MSRASRVIVAGSLALSCLLSPDLVWAKPIIIEVVPSENRVLVGDLVTLQIKATSSVNGDVEVVIPKMVGFRETRRSQGDSTSFSWTSQGQTLKRERTIQLELEATQAGKLTIPSIAARVGEHIAKSTPIPMQVDAVDDPSEAAEVAEPGEVIPPGPSEKELFVRYRLDKSEAYLGEQVFLDLEIFAAGNFQLNEAKGPPPLDGFWKEVVDQPSNLAGTARMETIGRRRYRVYRLWRAAIYPLEAGERVITPTAFTFVTNRSIFSSGRRLRRKVPAVKLTVKPLPNEGRPSGFSSTNVGTYELSASVDRHKVPAGKAIMLTLTLRGSGNIQNVKLPEVKSIDGFRAFPPTLKEDIEKSAAGIRGAKHAEILLMPLRGGRLIVPSFELVTFDPGKKAYERSTTESIAITVDGDPSRAVAPTPPPSAQSETEIQPSGLALVPLRFSSSLASDTRGSVDKIELAGMLGLPPLLFLLLLLLESLVERARRETPSSRQRRALKEARERLGRASALDDAYSEISEALLAFASQRAGENLRGLARPDLVQMLTRLGGGDIAVRLEAVLDRCDFSRFSPDASGRAVEETLEAAQEIVSLLSAWRPEARE